MNGTTEYDIAIVGGGLAGLSLAIQAADSGRKVILFEKEEYPFHKVCGEYISRESWGFLERLGVDLTAMNLPLIDTLQLSDAKGRAYTFDLPLGGFGISRYCLDEALYKQAVTKGVQVATATKVDAVEFANDTFSISANHVRYRARIVAGSFGKRSNLDVKWHRSFVEQKPSALNNYIGVKYHIRHAHAAGQIALHNFYNGYCGMSKIEDDKSCLCYLTTAANLKNCGNSIGEMEKKVLWKNKQLRDIFTQAEFLYEKPLTISQVSFAPKSLVEDHVLLAGDAAGMISPLCGNGMSMALHASKLLFESMEDYLAAKIDREKMERTYIHKWKEQFSRRLFTGRMVQRFFGGEVSNFLFYKWYAYTT